MAANKVMTLEVRTTGVDRARADLEDFARAAARGSDKQTKALLKALRRQMKAERNAAKERTKNQKRTNAELIRRIKELEEAKRRAEDADRARSEREQQRSGKLIQSLKGVAAGYIGVAGASKLWQAGKEGARALALDKAYRATGRSVEDLDKLMASMGHTVNRTTATALSNMGHTFKFSSKEMQSFGAIARAAAVKTGQDTEFMFNSIVTGTARQSRMILDNLGIMISAADANNRYAEQLGKTAKELTDVEKKQAFVNEVMRQGGQIVKDAPVDRLSANLAQVETELSGILTTMKKIVAQKLLGPIAEAFTGNYITVERSRRTQVELHRQALNSMASRLGAAKKAGGALDADTLREMQKSIALGAKQQKQFEAYLKLSGGRNDSARRFAQQLLLDRVPGAQKAAGQVAQRLADEEIEAKLLAAEDAENEKIVADIEKKRRLKKEARAKRAKANAKRAAARARRDAEKARRDAEKQFQQDIRDGVQWLTDLYEKADKAQTARIHKAKEAAIQAAKDRQTALMREARALQKVLDTYDGLDSTARTKLRAKRDAVVSQLDGDNQTTVLDERDSGHSEQGQRIAQAGGMLALLNAKLEGVEESKIRAIGDALHAGIVTPMSIAADTAADFGHSMANAAAAAIFEGKSIKKATNAVLKQIARRATAMAIFEGAAALASLAILDFRGAALHGKAAASFGIVALASGLGAAATGGVFDRNGAQATPTGGPGVETPRTASDGRVSGGVQNVFYMSYSGLRNRREDQDFIFDLMNHNAGVEGGQQLDPRLIPGAY